MKDSQKANTTGKSESRTGQLLISGKALQKLCARVLEEECHDQQEEAKGSKTHDDHVDNTENVNKFYTSIRTLNCIFIKRLHIKRSRVSQEYEIHDNEENKMLFTNNKKEAESEQQWIYKQICALHWIAAADVESHIFDIQKNFAHHISKPVIIFTPFENLETIAVNQEYISNLVTSSFTANDLNTLYVNRIANKLSTIINMETSTEATLSEALSAHTPALSLDVQNSEVKLHVDESKQKELTTHTVNSEERLADENTNHSFARTESLSASKLSKLALEKVSCTVTSTDIACVNNMLQMYYKCCARNREQSQRLESKECINVTNVENVSAFAGLDHIFSNLHSLTCVLCGRLPVKICTLTCCGALLCEKCVNYYITEEEKEEYEPQHEKEYEFQSLLSRKSRSNQAQNIICSKNNSEEFEVLNDKQAQYNASKQLECLVCHELLHNVQVNFHSDQDDELRALVRCLKVMYKPYFVKSALPSLSSSSSSAKKKLLSDNNVLSGNWQTFNNNANTHNLQKFAGHESNDYINNNLQLEYNHGNYFTNTQQNFQQVNEECTSARTSGNNTPIFNVTPKMHHIIH